MNRLGMYLQVLLQVYFIYNDIKVLQKGDFKVNPYKYQTDPDEAAADSAKEWITKLGRELPGMEIDKVLYNDTDITHLIKEAPQEK